MNHFNAIFIFLIMCTGVRNLHAGSADSISTLSAISLSYDYQFPFADMGKRFVSYSMPMLTYDVHHKSGYVFSLSAGYMYRDSVKENGLLSQIEKDGYLLDGSGQIVNVFLFQRGYTLSAKISKKFNLGSPKIYLLAGMGAGFMQHKILLYSKDFYLPQVQGEYAKGYDRLSNGFMLQQSLLLVHQPRGRSYLLFAGLNALQGFTQNRRSYNFDTMGPDLSKRKDFSIGLQFGFSIIFNRKIPQDYYYY